MWIKDMQAEVVDYWCGQIVVQFSDGGVSMPITFAETHQMHSEEDAKETARRRAIVSLQRMDATIEFDEGHITTEVV